MDPLIPDVPPEIPRTGGPITAWIGRCVLRLMRWRVVGALPREPKLVLIAAPHTSSWDFIVGMATKWAMRLESAYLAKQSLFHWPLSILLNHTGGVPVDRSARHQLVDQMTELFAQREKMILTVAPEGTRKRVDKWKTGFYHIAHSVGVPILPVVFDYSARRVRFEPTVRTTGDIEGDIARLRACYDGVARRDD